MTTLKDFFARHPRTALGFSGGTDSAYLLYAGTSLGADVRPYYIKTQFQPAFELADARRLADELGWSSPSSRRTSSPTTPSRRIRRTAAITANGRCSRSSPSGRRPTAIRSSSTARTRRDDPGDRPGTRALRELRVLSPLRECGITKADVRRLSREAGLFTYAKPSYACLATRVPTGRRIEAEALGRIEAAESALRALGYDDLRVRLCEGGVRLELPESELERAVRGRGEILRALDGMGRVTLDLRGR